MASVANHMNDNVLHHGVVVRTDAPHGMVQVRIDAVADCSACPAAALCGPRKGDSVINVPDPQAARFTPGERVDVVGSEELHRRAIAWLTFLPCVALIATMTGVFLLWRSELAAVLAGIGMTVFFFVMLYCFRNRITRRYNLRLIRINK